MKPIACLLGLSKSFGIVCLLFSASLSTSQAYSIEPSADPRVRNEPSVIAADQKYRKAKENHTLLVKDRDITLNEHLVCVDQQLRASGTSFHATKRAQCQKIWIRYKAAESKATAYFETVMTTGDELISATKSAENKYGALDRKDAKGGISASGLSSGGEIPHRNVVKPSMTAQTPAKSSAPTEKFTTSDTAQCKSTRNPLGCVKFGIASRTNTSTNEILVFNATNSCSDKVKIVAKYNGCGIGGSGQMKRSIESSFKSGEFKSGFGGTGSCQASCGCTEVPEVTHAECSK